MTTIIYMLGVLVLMSFALPIVFLVLGGIVALIQISVAKIKEV